MPHLPLISLQVSTDQSMYLKQLLKAWESTISKKLAKKFTVPTKREE